MNKSFSFIILCVMMIVLLSSTQKANAATCNPQDLLPCAGFLSSGAPPSKACCGKLKAQQPCFCGYVKNPSLKQYINSPNAKKVASACGVSIPKC
ncbi:Bifunctional inhibitor/plant lipid transfer protein/seed storage helical domain-containing protein [Cynara cardunculus var. scolymus]|uniref:Bifunctional inhibitor/plant lipid transfer protein/seed storage helical domain-containing protein n=1 Tax=Cynara cardunculus var. scolymus TaxID=59895 RepID=A0A103Y098_CYNCS|nr:Bifunctional inhibitor/plant lipid transfer protein/seed storage helical domain-containing protein [Cynara cardunculus var. scolymus]